MSIVLKRILQIFLVLLIFGVLFIYLNYFWHYPRNRRYEGKMIRAIENLKLHGDTTVPFRLDSIMNFKWDRIIHLGPYLDVPESTIKCRINFYSKLKNSRLNTDERFSGLLFLDKKNNIVKFLQFEGLIYGFEEINKVYPCGVTKKDALFRLWRYGNEAFFRIRLVKY
jgi:hypothetical protein